MAGALGASHCNKSVSFKWEISHLHLLQVFLHHNLYKSQNFTWSTGTWNNFERSSPNHMASQRTHCKYNMRLRQIASHTSSSKGSISLDLSPWKLHHHHFVANEFAELKLLHSNSFVLYWALGCRMFYIVDPGWKLIWNLLMALFEVGIYGSAPELLIS